jgi:5-methylcytosine-specific restriction endonuclease McrA
MTMLQMVMSIEISTSAALSDSELLVEVKALASREREAIARLIAVLGEVDARRLYLVEGCSSLFTYCTQVLHLSEHAAYGRIEAARAARKWPVILEHLADGFVHLTAVTLLAPRLTAANHLDLLAAARHKSKREVETIVAALRPQAPVPSIVRKLPTPKDSVSESLNASTFFSSLSEPSVSSPNGTSEAAAVDPPTTQERRAEIKPLAPERYKVQFTVSREVHDQLREAQDLLRHRIPNGDVAVIFQRALAMLLSELRKAKHAATKRPRKTEARGSKGRHIPAAVKRKVWQRDGGRCAFQGSAGRCTERGFLEYHHVVPFVDRGATTADNLELRCRAHNAYEVERWFGVGEEDVVREAAALYHAAHSVQV